MDGEFIQANFQQYSIGTPDGDVIARESYLWCGSEGYRHRRGRHYLMWAGGLRWQLFNYYGTYLATSSY